MVAVEESPEPLDVDAALEALGLRREWLMSSIKAGVLAQSESTAIDPPGASGYLAWLGTVRHLRKTMIREHWTYSNAGNLASVTSPDGKRSILVAQGNRAVGDLTKLNPRSKGKRGTSTKRKLAGNCLRIELLGQYPLFAWQPDLPVSIKDATKAEETWWLLLNRDERRGVVSAELALPLDLDEKGRLTSMIMRLPLGDVPIDQDDDVTLTGPTPSDDKSSGTNIPFEVKRRIGN
jgi:hypothetical protein